MFSLQENTTASPDDVSALERVWHTPGYSRFIYAAYAILGIIFFGIGIYTALDLLMSFLNRGTILLTFGTLLSLCYVLINTIIGYGFVFYRKWLSVAFSSALILAGLLAAFFFISGDASREAALFTSMSMTSSILLFLFLTRHILSGRYVEPGAVIPFASALIFSFLFINFAVLH